MDRSQWRSRALAAAVEQNLERAWVRQLDELGVVAGDLPTTPHAQLTPRTATR